MKKPLLILGIIIIVGGIFLFQTVDNKKVTEELPWHIEMHERFEYSAVTGSIYREFRTDSNGIFIWKKAVFNTIPRSPDEIRYDEKSGRIPKEKILRLRAQLAEAGPGPLAEDASTVTFTWIDERGDFKESTYQMSSYAPAKDLIETIDQLVQQYDGVVSGD